MYMTFIMNNQLTTVLTFHPQWAAKQCMYTEAHDMVELGVAQTMPMPLHVHTLNCVYGQVQMQ